MLYALARHLLFRLDPERAHDLSFQWMERLAPLAKLRLPGQALPAVPREVMGLRFPNAVGLAAGLDKNGQHIHSLAMFGFGFLEIGTVTPRPQAGNPLPRLFRLPEAEAIINRMGFNNGGVDALVERVRQAAFPGILGINIGKNADTPMERAVDDYRLGLQAAYQAASYITVNISSPNTKNLRQLQQADELGQLLSALKLEQARLTDQHGKYVPLAVKIAPDLDAQQLDDIAHLLTRHRLDAVIATNTTVGREGVEHLQHADETGGLSGAPVRDKSTRVIRELAQRLQGEVPIIGVGGILSGAHAQEKLDAGAALVQLYTGLIYRGPSLVRECVTACG